MYIVYISSDGSVGADSATHPDTDLADHLSSTVLLSGFSLKYFCLFVMSCAGGVPSTVQLLPEEDGVCM
jgi:hypothetical protein